jgi:hypothetical protein
MPGFFESVIGSVTPCRSTNSVHVAILGVMIGSELIVHVIPVVGCVVLVTFVMFWMSRSAEFESVESAFSVEVEVEVTKINFY